MPPVSGLSKQPSIGKTLENNACALHILVLIVKNTTWNAKVYNRIILLLPFVIWYWGIYTNLFFCLFIKIALVPELNLLRICDLSLTIPTLFQDCHYPLCLMSQATFIYFFLSTDQDHFVLLFGVFFNKKILFLFPTMYQISFVNLTSSFWQSMP